MLLIEHSHLVFWSNSNFKPTTNIESFPFASVSPRPCCRGHSRWKRNCQALWYNILRVMHSFRRKTQEESEVSGNLISIVPIRLEPRRRVPALYQGSHWARQFQASGRGLPTVALMRLFKFQPIARQTSTSLIKLCLEMLERERERLCARIQLEPNQAPPSFSVSNR